MKCISSYSDTAPYNLSLRNVNRIDDMSSDEENDEYARIGPHLLRPGVTGTTASSTTLIQNQNAISGPRPSIHHIPAPIGDTINSVYAEIDSGEKRQLRRPSNYKSVLVQNIGLSSMEDLNSLSSAPFLPGDEEEYVKKDMSEYEVPGLHPAVKNHYEAISNPGFLAGSEISLAHSIEDETCPIKVTRVHSISSNPLYSTSSNPRHSTSSNPMYSTSISSLDGKCLKTGSESYDEHRGTPKHTEDGYSIPNKVNKPDLSSNMPDIHKNVLKKNPSPVRVPDGSHGDAEQMYVNNGRIHASHVMYTIPTSPGRSSTDGVSRAAPPTYETLPDRPGMVASHDGYSIPHLSSSAHNSAKTGQSGTKLNPYDKLAKSGQTGTTIGYDKLAKTGTRIGSNDNPRCSSKVDVPHQDVPTSFKNRND